MDKENQKELSKVIWHIRINNGIRQFFPSYREMNEIEIKQVPDIYWQDDPIHITRLKA